jgi:hypothetical protein
VMLLSLFDRQLIALAKSSAPSQWRVASEKWREDAELARAGAARAAALATRHSPLATVTITIRQ